MTSPRRGVDPSLDFLKGRRPFRRFSLAVYLPLIGWMAYKKSVERCQGRFGSLTVEGAGKAGLQKIGGSVELTVFTSAWSPAEDYHVQPNRHRGLRTGRCHFTCVAPRKNRGENYFCCCVRSSTNFIVVFFTFVSSWRCVSATWKLCTTSHRSQRPRTERHASVLGAKG